MTAEEILTSPDFQKCHEFHGHICPGLSVGYKAAKAGLERMHEKRAADEELVAVVETDACCADAVQVLTGCTFGKGNFIYRDYGKMVFTFFSRESGRGVRLALKPGVMEPNEEHQALLQKIMQDRADATEKERFETLHMHKSREVLEKTAEELFEITDAQVEMPDKAVIAPSHICEECGEPVMSTKTVQQGEKRICRACAGS